MTNKKGFTLVELLAVITILAAVALITAPIIVNTITESRESANTVSATNYIRAVDTTIRTESLDDFVIEDGFYKISKDGNICLNELKNGNCIGEKLKITAKGNKPIKGNVTIEDDEVARATIVFEEFSVELGYDGEIEYKPFSLKYDIGEAIKVVGENDTENSIVTWYVIGEDLDTITLLYSDVVATSEWISSSDYSKYKKTSDSCSSRLCSYIGPVTPISTLIAGFKDLDVLEIDNYEYVNNSSPNNKYEYQKYTIKNGLTTYIDYAGNKIIIPGKTKGRIMSAEEILKIASMYNLNLTYKNLKEYVNNRFDGLNAAFSSIIGNKQSLEEMFDALGMEDNWITVYFFTALLNSDLTNPEVLKFVMPDWLSVENKTVQTSTSTTVVFNSSLAESNVFTVEGLFLEDGTKVSALLPAPYYSSRYIQPVIQIRKDDKRIQ